MDKWEELRKWVKKYKEDHEPRLTYIDSMGYGRKHI